ncbi:hypothetical protein ShirakiTB12_39430 [Priestia megaterium]|uniref:Uncharacterized protein n=1 Tax=Priestia megaterium TaxID=1404 RepID=A0AAX6BNZ6_PRIMG|nr:hypothetical protein [Priestia megaterium]GMG75475.1 hypothetical protein ShirakiTB12_39430 [Priestia megaterium]
MKTEKVVKELVLFRGKKYMKEETEMETILTSVEKDKADRNTVFVFTKDTEHSEKAMETVSKMISKTLITSYLTE